MIRLRTGDVAWQRVDDEIVCLDLRTSRYLSINASGTELWPMVVEGAESERLVDQLVERFEIDRASAERDVAAFVQELTDRDLLEDS